MDDTKQCLKSKNGFCDSKGRLKCNKEYTGQLCKVKIQECPLYTSPKIFRLKPISMKYYKTLVQSHYDKLILGIFDIENLQKNCNSYVWEMGSIENYIQSKAKTPYKISTVIYPNKIPDNSLPLIEAKIENYFMIHNNYPTINGNKYILFTLNIPHDGPICICTNNKCSKNTCEIQNTYTPSLIGYPILSLVQYLNDSVIYIDQSIYIDFNLLSYIKLNFELLNKHKEKHTIILANSTCVKITYLSLKDLILKFTESSYNKNKTVFFDSLVIFNTKIESNEHKIFVDKLTVDFRSYDSSIISNHYFYMNDNEKSITQIQIGKNSMLIFNDTEYKAIPFNDGIKVNIEIRKEPNEEFKVISNEGDFNFTFNVEITFNFTNPKHCNYSIEPLLKNKVKLICHPEHSKILTESSYIHILKTSLFLWKSFLILTILFILVNY